ncbi:membrane-associated progesterone-binding protein 4 isoform X1 [Malania oleifera]|uniref:membrane-associated progesterone-binding protein 4 isoform X1 n=1 Tax=Malania oleifera TaxID=397392 RepID=UPI0025ADD75D|nr:membrane-associated progesterone-binding protein 4 isoform X1 [Malania oleifera]
MAAKILVVSPFIGIAISVILVALFVRFPFRFQPQQRLFTVEELALHNGTDDNLPILLGILGAVFDVTKGKSHYGREGGYNHFAGRDASRAFVSGNFTGDGLTDSLRGLSSTQVKSIVEWREFYFRSYTYIKVSRLINWKCSRRITWDFQMTSFLRFVGKLVGHYYDSEGNPTKYLKGVEAKAARGTQLLEKQKEEEAKIPSCSSRWSQEEGGEVWCDTGYPRLVQRPLDIALTGKVSKRCACFKEEELDQSGFEVYEGCDFLANRCRV